MEVTFKKDLRHNYMVISTDHDITAEPYCIKLLSHQTIDGFLILEQRRIDHQILYYYDITAKQSISSLFDKATLSYDRVRNLFKQIIITIDRAYDYLLTEDDFLLTPEAVFIDVLSNMPSLCYLPGYHKNIKEQINSFIEFIMNKVDYNDKEAVLLVYQLYAAGKEEGFTLDHLLKIMDGNKNDKPHKDSYLSQKETESTVEAINIKSSTNGKDSPSTPSNIPVMMEKLTDEEERPCYPLSIYLFSGICLLGGILIYILGFTSKILYNTFGNRIDLSKLMALSLIVLCVEGYLMRKLWDKKNQVTKIVEKHEYIDPRNDFGRSKNILELRNKNSDYNIHPQRELYSKEKRSINQEKRNEYEGYTGQKKYIEKEDTNKEDTNKEDTNIEDTNKEDTNKDRHTDMIRRTDKRGHADNHRIILSEHNNEEEDYNPTCLLSETIQQQSVINLKPVDEIKYQSIIIKEFPFFIGKLKKNVDYCLEKDVVSRYHAKITKEQEQYYITDLNSTNGTFLNKELLQTYQKREVKPGDEISFANISFIMQLQ
jgi:hypothetical protein